MRLPTTLTVLASLAISSSAHAVILYRSETRNTTAPTGAWADSGWDLQVRFGAYSATPVGPRHILTARHLGGNTVNFRGVTYERGRITDVPGTDLRLIEIVGTLPEWADLYNPAVHGSPIGKPLVVYGRGTQRGEAIYTTPTDLLPDGTPPRLQPGLLAFPARPIDVLPDPAPQLAGWRWGFADFVPSWGTNVVDNVLSTDSYGQLLTFDFDADGTPHESSLSGGDSGGGVFIQTADGWKLAGVNFSADGGFRLTPDDEPFNAALLDARGLYYGDPADVLLDAQPINTSSYSTYVGAYRDFLLTAMAASSTVAVPEPHAGAALAMGTLLLRRRRQKKKPPGRAASVRFD